MIAGAGNETTGRLIGWLAKLLAEHPDQRRALVEDRSLIPNAIDETLRFEPTGHATARCVTHDVDYYGTTVPTGSPVLLLMASANRDSRRYDDADVDGARLGAAPAHPGLRPPHRRAYSRDGLHRGFQGCLDRRSGVVSGCRRAGRVTGE